MSILTARRGTVSARSTGGGGGGTFSPLDIGWASAFWAEDPNWTAPSFADADALPRWIGYAGDSPDLTPSSGSPTFYDTTHSLDSQPVVRLDGNDNFAVPALFGAAVAGVTWVFVVEADTSANTDERLLAYGDPDHYHRVRFNHSAGTVEGFIYDGTDGAATITPADTAAPMVVIIKGSENGNSIIRVNGTEAVGDALGASFSGIAGSRRIGSARDDTLFWTGNVAAVAAFDTELSTSDCEDIEAHYNTKYSLGFTSSGTAKTPDEVANLQLWCEADSAGGPVSSWRDDGTNGDDAVQATGSNQPIYHPTGINDQPSVRAHPDRFLLTSSFAAPTGKPWTAVAVATLDTASAATYLFDHQGTGGRCVVSYQAAGMSFGDGVAGATAAFDPTVKMLIVGEADGSGNLSLEINGTEIATDTGGSSDGVADFVIGQPSGVTNNSAFTMAFLGLKDGLLTSQERSELETWASDTYGITI